MNVEALKTMGDWGIGGVQEIILTTMLLEGYVAVTYGPFLRTTWPSMRCRDHGLLSARSSIVGASITTNLAAPYS